MEHPKSTPRQIRHALQCAAACDAIVTAEDWLRVFRYEQDRVDGSAMATYDNGGGDHVFVFFTADGKAVIKGFDHESAVSPHARDEFEVWPGIYDGIAPALMALLTNESVEHEHVTFCCWSNDGETWESGSAHIPEELDDGSGWLLDMLQMDAEQFDDWARSYYGEDFACLGGDKILKIYQAQQE